MLRETIQPNATQIARMAKPTPQVRRSPASTVSLAARA
jgi:hypothetical protein